MSNDAPSPPADGFPQGHPSDMQDLLLSPPTGGKPPSSPSSPWVPPTAEELGRLLPDYEIVKMLGRGGMGAVYMGRQKSLDRPVAIKILSTALEDADPSFAERFKNEARAMGKLSHPGIVAVHDFGETQGGLLYIVMEYIEGTDVARMIAAEGRLHTEHAMAITAHVCDALAYAHERGIIHRDIKPANIMVGYDGVVKVADFGLAKMNKAGETGLTQSGMVMGTLHYMAPEALVLGSGVDQRADIYAVGVMLYQMLTGKIPQGMFELPSLQIKGLDPRYDAIIAKALREDRDVRYQSARELRGDLDNILTQPVAKVEAEAKKAPAALPTQGRPQRPAGQPYRPPQAKRQPQPARRSSSSWVVWVVVVLSGLVGAYWLVKKRALSPELAPGSIELASPETNPSAVVPAATQEVPFVNSLGMKFVPVPGTDVLFCIHETRRQDYATYADEVPGVDGAWKNQKRGGIPCGDKDDHPVVGVSWENAQEFCQWLSKREGKSYRLPTDEEWSIAVGLGSKEKRAKGITPEMLHQKEQTEFPWGADYPPKTEDKAGNYADSIWLEKFPSDLGMKDYTDGFPTTAPVMSFKPNKLGLYDMGGNVLEWVADWWNEAKTDRVLRGGSFFSHAQGQLLSSDRIRPLPGERPDRNGFRCVLVMTSGAVAARREAPMPPPVVRPVTPPAADPKATHTNTLGMTFVPVPGTEVMFCIHETRYKDYAAYAAENPTVNNAWKNQTTDGYTITERHEDHPVTQVSWEDAKAFCAWLSKKEGKTYRLPTDAEWSIAVGIGNLEKRSPNTTPAAVTKASDAFPWGTDWPPPKSCGNFSDESRKSKAPNDAEPCLDSYDDGFPTTAPVMSFAPTSLGLFDLDGNVREWVEDWWDESRRERVLRGAGWADGNRPQLLSSRRGHSIQDSRYNVAGFRLVMLSERRSSSAPRSSAPSEGSASATPDILKKATQSQPFENTLGMKFVPVPGTKVLFCIHETRIRDYTVFAQQHPGVDMGWKVDRANRVQIIQDADHPVVLVSWSSAKAFCDWLSAKEGQRYRLPTDREWSMAVGVGDRENTTQPSGDYPWGIQWPPPPGIGNYADSSATYRKASENIAGYRDGFPFTSPVMSFPPNQYGIFDLGGNVCEVCEDGGNEGQPSHNWRGGSYGEVEPYKMQSSFRLARPHNYTSNHSGFRVVLELP